MKHAVRHGGKISCDVRGCTEIFVTYSMATLVRRQAIEAGWRLLPFVMYPEAQRKKVDACPGHAVELAEEFQFIVAVKRICDFEAQLASRIAATLRRAKRVDTIAKKHARFVKRAAKVFRSIMREARREVRAVMQASDVLDPVGDWTSPTAPADRDADIRTRLATISEMTPEEQDRQRESFAFGEARIPEPETFPVVRPRRGRPKRGSSSLVVVLEVLREAAAPLSVQEIVELAGSRLPSTSKTPHTVVSRDLAMEIKLKGDGAVVERTAPGRFKLRETVPF